MGTQTTDLVEHIDHFQRRVLQDAVSDATAAYWRQRAQMLRWAAPRPGDFTGGASVEEIDLRRRRLERMAELCEHRAELAVLR